MFLHGLVRFAGLEHAPVVVLIFFSQLFREKVEICPANNFIQCFAEHLAELLVGKSETLFEILAENILRNGLDQRLIQGF